ncbi:hypothetical protein DID77_01200 [Candidatus Marinamargulisbacteria bacterium SCGC AG-439-L15]|nr:hypothetical protein DID77_01200 [Candidatus Marinamargulisbacteria bacterium SCGC AG-439-L15]
MHMFKRRKLLSKVIVIGFVIGLSITGYLLIKTLSEQQKAPIDRQKQTKIETAIETKINRLLSKIFEVHTFEVLVTVSLHGENNQVEQLVKQPHKILLKQNDLYTFEEIKNTNLAHLRGEYKPPEKDLPGFSNVIKTDRLSKFLSKTKPLPEEKMRNNEKKESDSEMLYFDVNKKQRFIPEDKLKNRKVLIIIDTKELDRTGVSIQNLYSILKQSLGLNPNRGDSLTIRKMAMIKPKSVTEKILLAYKKNSLLFNGIGILMALLATGSVGYITIKKIREWMMKRALEKRLEDERLEQAEIDALSEVEVDPSLYSQQQGEDIYKLAKDNPEALSEALSIWLEKKGGMHDTGNA